MIDLSNLAWFLTASWVLIVTPGPDMIYVVSRGVAQGRKAAIVSVCGIILGLTTHTLAAAFGLALVLKTSAIAFEAIKYLGAAYLVYLGIKMIRSNEGIVVGEASPLNTRAVFVQGLLSCLFNPKLAMFFLAFLPQFVNPALGSETLQMVSLGALFSVFGFSFLFTVAYFSGAVGNWVASKPTLLKRIGWVSGGTLIALGLRLAFTQRA